MVRDKPSPPETIPKYIAEGLPKQDTETLYDIQSYIEELIDWNTEIPEVDTETDEELVDIEEDPTKGAIVTKKIPCGKECNGCPHGPYDYRVYRSKGEVVWEYIGKSNQTDRES